MDLYMCARAHWFEIFFGKRQTNFEGGVWNFFIFNWGIS